MNRRDFLRTGAAGMAAAGALRSDAVDTAAEPDPFRDDSCGMDVGRQEFSLNGEWRFRTEANGEGEQEGYHRPGYDAGAWDTVSIPAGFGTVTGDMWFTGAVWFRRSFPLPPGFEAKRVVLRFDGVNNHAQVWINGEKLAENEAPYLPWEVLLENRLFPGEENTLVVRVDNQPVKTQIPYSGGWHHDGGIVRDVRLIATNLLYVEDARVTARPTDPGECDVEVWLSNAGDRPASLASVKVSILDQAGDCVATGTIGPANISGRDSAQVSIRLAVPDAKPWSPESPILYMANLLLQVGDKPVDRTEVRFGFREIAVSGDKLLLNGSPLYLLGFNRHEDSPRTGMAPDPERLRADLLKIKQAGGNFLRWSHYPQDPFVADLCDELGLLVMVEAPIGTWDGVSQEHLVAAKHYVRELIRRYRNHASIVFWSVGNESNEGERMVVERNDDLIQLARQLDPTRLVVHVSERSRWVDPNHHPLFEYDDVICVNGYPSELGRIWAKNADYDFGEAASYWRKVLAELYERYHKPILITEFGYPSGAALQPSFDGEAGEQMQAEAIAAEFEAFQEPYICGATVWCFADHPWPKNAYHADISPYGVLHRDRRPKAAWPEVQRLFQAHRDGGGGN